MFSKGVNYLVGQKKKLNSIISPDLHMYMYVRISIVLIKLDCEMKIGKERDDSYFL